VTTIFLFRASTEFDEMEDAQFECEEEDRNVVGFIVCYSHGHTVPVAPPTIVSSSYIDVVVSRGIRRRSSCRGHCRRCGNT
jgi:hypothetical protein